MNIITAFENSSSSKVSSRKYAVYSVLSLIEAIRHLSVLVFVGFFICYLFCPDHLTVVVTANLQSLLLFLLVGASSVRIQLERLRIVL
ncbi:hypothetical protein V1506DRAFT_535725 [Lipomyces tetrasporus]